MMRRMSIKKTDFTEDLFKFLCTFATMRYNEGDILESEVRVWSKTLENESRNFACPKR